jgi:PST family polysaccharide transporter
MALYAVPHIIWCIHGTNLRLLDIARVAGKPLISGVVAAAVCLAFQVSAGQSLTVLARLVSGLGLMGLTYGAMLLYGMGQRAFYADLFRTVFARGEAADVGQADAHGIP